MINSQTNGYFSKVDCMGLYSNVINDLIAIFRYLLCVFEREGKGVRERKKVGE